MSDDPRKIELRKDHALAGHVTHEEAHQILSRFNASHFRGRMGPNTEEARYTIPANPRRDDDIRLSAYIAQNERIEHAAREVIAVAIAEGTCTMDSLVPLREALVRLAPAPRERA